MLSIRNLTKQYPSFRLGPVSLELADQSVACLIGPSGSGKSTLLRCINLLDRPESGSLQFSGGLLIDVDSQLKSLSSDSLEQLRTRVGYVAQEPHLWPHRTVIQNVYEAPFRVLGLPLAEAIERSRQLLWRVGLEGFEERRPATLSGGEAQRVSLARALAMQPQLLLLDEITSALDIENVSIILRILEDLAHNGTSMLIATHHLRFAEQVADSVFVLQNGEVVEEGSPQKILYHSGDERTARFLEHFRRLA